MVFPSCSGVPEGRVEYSLHSPQTRRKSSPRHASRATPLHEGNTLTRPEKSLHIILIILLLQYRGHFVLI
jgi:hypothetical protein